MENQIFRKKSLDALSAPEDLTDYLHVTQPAIWVVLISVIILIAGIFLWSNFMVIESKVTGLADVDSGVAVISFDKNEMARRVQTGMELIIGEESFTITSVGTDDLGKVIAKAKVEMPDGNYPCAVIYRSTKVLELLFN